MSNSTDFMVKQYNRYANKRSLALTQGKYNLFELYNKKLFLLQKKAATLPQEEEISFFLGITDYPEDHVK